MDYYGPTVLDLDGEWYYVTETYRHDDDSLVDGSDELEGPFASEAEAQAAALKNDRRARLDD